jgi:serine/threonine protein kinase
MTGSDTTSGTKWSTIIIRAEWHRFIQLSLNDAELGLDARLTETGISVGTPAYMSPEAAVGEEVDLRADICSLGVMLYELFLHKPPFEGDDSTAILYAHPYKSVPLLSIEDPSFPFALESVILKCLAKDRRDRYSTIRHFVSDFDDALYSLTDMEANRCYGVFS